LHQSSSTNPFLFKNNSTVHFRPVEAQPSEECQKIHRWWRIRPSIQRSPSTLPTTQSVVTLPIHTAQSRSSLASRLGLTLEFSRLRGRIRFGVARLRTCRGGHLPQSPRPSVLCDVISAVAGFVIRAGEHLLQPPRPSVLWPNPREMSQSKGQNESEQETE
jgi:hypothetical protein